MTTCEVCGNDYGKALEVVAAGQRHVVDSFGCAIHRMAPTCQRRVHDDRPRRRGGRKVLLPCPPRSRARGGGS
jgi:hypothetical protein